MHSDSGATASSWMSVPLPFATPTPLTSDVETDVCIVGGGLAGVSIAYQLTRRGLRVVLLDDGEIGSGETARTTAHLASALDDGFEHLISLFGEEGAKTAYDSHAAAIDLIEQTIAEEGIECDFSRLDGYLYAPTAGEAHEIKKEFDAVQRIGIAGVQLLGSAPLPSETGPAIRFPRQGQFHPMRYLLALADRVLSNKGQFFTHTRAMEIRGGKQPFVLSEAKHRVNARHVVVATNTPVNDMVVMHTKQAPYRTYAMAFQISPASITPGLYWDNLDPYHYARLHVEANRTLLIVGGEDHKTGQAPGPEKAMVALEQWARRTFPKAGAIAYQWSGQVMEPVDALAFIGRNPGDDDNVYIVTGDSGHGMTHSTIASMLIPDLITGKGNPWQQIYDPRRKSLKSAGTFAQENINVAAQYRDYATSGEVASVDQLAPTEGAVLREGVHKFAIYRDGDGKLHKFSAVCPHLKCIVRWNPLEKTWDCPCHGSRFACDGHVINGPANVGLPSADE